MGSFGVIVPKDWEENTKQWFVNQAKHHKITAGYLRELAEGLESRAREKKSSYEPNDDVGRIRTLLEEHLRGLAFDKRKTSQIIASENPDEGYNLHGQSEQEEYHATRLATERRLVHKEIEILVKEAELVRQRAEVEDGFAALALEDAKNAGKWAPRHEVDEV